MLGDDARGLVFNWAYDFVKMLAMISRVVYRSNSIVTIKNPCFGLSELKIGT